MKLLRLLRTLPILFLPCTGLVAQDLEEIGLKKGVKLSGAISANTVAYMAHGIEQRRDPFNWFVSGSLNVTLFGYSAPFSFSYSNANKNYTQPFNQFSFAPRYKWVQTYVGYNAMTFSSYTLSGYVFLGGGVELSPGKWKIAAMYGRLKKAVTILPMDTLQYNNAAYKRMGYGFKVGYDDNGNAISFNIFKAKDDVTSLAFVPPQSQLTPQQNIAFSLAGRKKFLKRFFIEGEYAISVLSKDIRANAEQRDTTALKPSSNILKGLLPENATTRYYDAVNSSVGYQGNTYSVQVRYERIAPEYQTMGAYYFNNDMQNITIAPSVQLLKGRLTVALNTGFQKNNLDKSRAATTQRFVGSAAVNFNPNEKWNFGFNYSNFSAYTNMRPQNDPFFQNTMDTLNFYQISQTASLTVLRNLGTKEKPQAIMINTSYQKASDYAGYADGDQQSVLVNANLSYTYSLPKQNIMASLSANGFQSQATTAHSLYWGPSLNLAKGFMEKTMRVSLITAYNKTSGSDAEVSPVLNNRMNFTYTPKSGEGSSSKHTLALSANYVIRLKSTERQQAYSELTITFNYAYAF